MSIISKLKQAVPAHLRSRINKMREDKAVLRLYQSFRRIQRQDGRSGDRSTTSILIVPTDPFTLLGARGDDAMISTAVYMAKRRFTETKIFIVTASVAADELAISQGFEPVNIWRARDYISALRRTIDNIKADAVVVVGGDVIDGHYGALIAAKLLVSAHVASSAGIPTTILGFSFNKYPIKQLRDFLDNLDPRIQINVRDNFSLVRFNAFTNATAELVADSAFLLPAELSNDIILDVKKWLHDQRSRGRQVLGLNLHPFLFQGVQSSDLEEILRKIADSVVEVAGMRNVSFFFFPHDDRGSNGDDVCLIPIFDLVREKLGDQAYYLSGNFNAATLKAAASLLDGVVAGRMHLAIASLGMNVPVMALTYQDKFEGLYQHFNLPDWLLLTPEQLSLDDILTRSLCRFLNELPTLRHIVETELNNVKHLSEMNYRIFAKPDEVQQR